MSILTLVIFEKEIINKASISRTFTTPSVTFQASNTNPFSSAILPANVSSLLWAWACEMVIVFEVSAVGALKDKGNKAIEALAIIT